jgi:hypothetical protein
MTLESIRSYIRGWFPQESTLPTQHKLTYHIPYMSWWLATGITGGAGVAGLLVLLGEVTGINSGYAALLWYIEVAFLAWCIGSFIAIYGYLRHKRATEGQRHEDN